MQATIEDAETVLEDSMSSVQCPRSIYTRIEINKSCVNKECSFYCGKVSYNCFLIHQSIFFKNYSELPDSVIEVGLNRTSREIDVLNKFSKYHLRISILKLQYSNYKKGTTTILPIRVCSTCGSIFEVTCKCYTKRVLERRLKFNKRWKLAIIKSESSTTELDNPDSINLIRDKVCKTVSELPFAYLFTHYMLLFNVAPWELAENLGISYNLYEKAIKIFDQQENV